MTDQTVHIGTLCSCCTRAEFVGALLLAFHRRLGWPRRLGLKGAVYPLVCAVLFRVAGNDALDRDAVDGVVKDEL